MNNLIANFVGFNGRLNRQAWWIGVIILAVVSIVISWILNMVLGTGSIQIGADGSIDPNALASMVQKAGWSGLITNLIVSYPYLALTIKRRHDRNNNGYDAMAVIGVGVLYNLLAALGLTVSLGIVGAIVGIILLVLAIYVLVQAGFLKGTAGANSYGPDPLGG
jgi:uncharacterized membrane protein YhaH (DUF805 family)